MFRRQLDAVLDSLERDLVAEQQAEDQSPSAAEIVVVPDRAFRPDRLVVASAVAAQFVIEDIRIGSLSQFVGPGGISASMFDADAVDAAIALDATPAGTEIRFRVRYVGSDPRGARFQGALIGRVIDSSARQMLPIDSGIAIVG